MCRDFVVAVYFFVTSGHFSISHLLLISLSVGRLTRENTRLKSPGPREKNLGPDSQKKKNIYIYIPRLRCGVKMKSAQYHTSRAKVKVNTQGKD